MMCCFFSVQSPLRILIRFLAASILCIFVSGCSSDHLQNTKILSTSNPQSEKQVDLTSLQFIAKEIGHSKAKSPKKKQQGSPQVVIPELAELEAFDRQSLGLANASKTELRLRMDSILSGLDSLAVEKSLPFAEVILEKINTAQKNSIKVASEANEKSQKGLWISWSEKLLFTRAALKHFFSEMTLQKFEKAIDSNQPDKFQAIVKKLKNIVHSDHERRLVAMLRRQDKSTPAFNAIIEALALSGGPLARLNIYQRFITEPNLQLAQVMARIGLPRMSDLIGENTHLNDGLPLVPNTRSGIHENALGQSFGNLKSQWEDMRDYLEDLANIPIRFERSRNKWLEIHQQIEFLINLLSIDDAQKSALKREILQSYTSTGERSELVYRRGGIEFREGDILLQQSSPIGGLWETFTESGSHLSHLLMVTFGDDGLPYTIEMNFGRLLIAPLDLHTDRYTVVRMRGLSAEQRQAIRNSYSKLLVQDVAYDFKFNSNSLEKLYCSELPAAILQLANLEHKPIPFPSASKAAQKILFSAGISVREFFTQGSYLSSRDFEVIGEEINSDPREFIRGQIVLDAFTNYVSGAHKIRLSKHPESHQLWALSALSQTTHADIRRAIGPQNFLFTIMTLDKLIHAIDSDTLRVQTQIETPNSQSSRITELKTALQDSLKFVVPRHLSSILPRGE